MRVDAGIAMVSGMLDLHMILIAFLIAPKVADGETLGVDRNSQFYVRRTIDQPVPVLFPTGHPPGRVRNDNRLHRRSTFPHRLHPVRFIAANNALRDGLLRADNPF